MMNALLMMMNALLMMMNALLMMICTTARKQFAWKVTIIVVPLHSQSGSKDGGPWASSMGESASTMGESAWAHE